MKSLTQSNMQTAAMRYAIGIGCVGAATLVRLFAGPWLGVEMPLVIFFPALLLAAFYAGLGPTLLVTVLGATAEFFLSSTDSNTPLDGSAWAGLALFAVTGVAASLLARESLLAVASGFPDRGSNPSRPVESLARSEPERDEPDRFANSAESLHDAVTGCVDYGVWVCDGEGNTVADGEPFLRLTGISRDDGSGSGWKRALHPDDSEQTVEAWQRCVAAGEPWHREYRVRDADGETHWILSKGTPVREESDRVLRWAGIRLDISQFKREQERLHKANLRKDEFLAMLVHELRNPLAPIRSGLDILAMDVDEHRETIELMQEQLEHVIRLVDDLLDLSRIMRDKVELRREPVELDPVIKRSANAVAPPIEQREQQLVITSPEDPVWVHGDPMRLAQILENLLANASKYTDVGGRIELSVQCREGRVTISVRDTGQGIDAEFLPHVFDLFAQSGEAATVTSGGLGIGLALVKRLVEMHSGSVAVHSDGPGHGSTFTIEMPRLTSFTREPQEQSAEEAPKVHDRRILVVDDNAGATWLLKMLLQKLDHHEVETAHDGPSALAKIREFHPDVVLLDIGLPGMDGLEVARAVREDEELDDVLLVALTGYGREVDRRRAKQAGIDEHLIKPPSVEHLKEILAHPKISPQDEAETGDAVNAEQSPGELV